MTRTARLRSFCLKCSVNWLFTISDCAKIIKMWLDEGVIDHFSHIQEASAISNDTNGPSLFRAPMPEDIFLTTWSGWFFQVDLAFPTWSWYFSLGFTFAFSYYLTSSPGSSRCRRHMGKREDPGDEVAYCLAAIIFVLLYFTFTEPIGLKDSKLCRYILEDFFLVL